MQEAFADYGDALQAVVESSNRSSEDIAGKDKAEKGQVWKRMLFLLDTEYAGASGRIRASFVRDDDELLWHVVCCTALILTRLDNIDGAHPVKGESDTANAWSVDQRRLRECRLTMTEQLKSRLVLVFFMCVACFVFVISLRQGA